VRIRILYTILENEFMSTWKYFLYWLFGWVIKAVTSLLFMTCRVQVFGQEIETAYLEKNKGKGLPYASWHRGLFFFVYFYRNLKFIVMASASKDGELATQATRRFGWIPVRGSSSRRGSQALQEMQVLFEKGHRGGLVVDAPTGPPCVSKIGIIILAKRTGLPILPVMWNADKSWRIKSWDRSIIPKPFSRIVFLYGDELLHVPTDASEEACENLRKELDVRLCRMMYQTDHFFRLPGITDPRDIKVPEPVPMNEVY
jgi:lysophospholipid acyltransferase (LPLAT)-like uncharacterized protein